MLSEGRTVIGGTAMLSCKVAQTQKEVTWFKDEKKLSASSEVREETQGRAQGWWCSGQGKQTLGSTALRLEAGRSPWAWTSRGVLTESIWRR